MKGKVRKACTLLIVSELSCPADDVHLLRWLRFAKFDVDLAYETVIKYYTMKRENFDVFDVRKKTNACAILLKKLLILDL